MSDQSATDLSAWGKRVEIPCDPTVVINEEGKAVMDAHFWMGYAAKANQYRRERNEAVALLLGVIEADRQDTEMGYPIPGDSCLAAHLGLVVMEWIDKHGRET